MNVDTDVGVAPELDSQGILGRIRRLLGALLQHLVTRGELLAAELAEEKERLVYTLVAAGILIFAVAMVVTFAGILALVLAWETPHRNLVAWLLPVLFLVVALGCLAWLKSLVGRKRALFRDSLRELRQDAQTLRG